MAFGWRKEFYTVLTPRGLDKRRTRSTIPGNSCETVSLLRQEGNTSGFMTSKPPLNTPNGTNQQPCKHPRVQIVSREDDAEFVECLECGDIFESSEFEDMSIEERTQGGEL